jgi:tetratricopeptide (TPR) repeat protein
MIGSSLGGHTIVAELGAGSMGIVYLADREGERRAIKVVHPHLIAAPGFFKRFLREAEVGRRVAHRNVVRAIDADLAEVDGRNVHYIVMEYVEGKTLRDLLDDLGTVPEALLREIATQSAAGLAAIHAVAIVHRDLKPENILITDDEEIRIMDLGVAKLQEASVAITRMDEFAGTVLYAAPEAFRGEPVGPPFDQYSLGVLLYELATGGNPFRRDSVGEVLAAHLSHDPPRLDERNRDVSGFLAEVVATLLAKQVQERFASAEALHGILAEGERSEWWRERARRPGSRETHRPRIRVHRETALHGRADDLELLRAAWHRACAGSGSTVVIEGEAGIGKTRLVDAFAAEVRDAHVLYGAYPPTGGPGGLSDAIVGKFGATDLEAAVRPYLPQTPTLVPKFAALIRCEPTPPGAEPIHRDALHAVYVQLMRRLAAERPTLWIVDDLQFADREGRELVLSLARATEGHRILLLATARPGLPEEELAHLGRLENVERLRLGRLAREEVRRLLADALGSGSLAERLGDRIAVKSDGVPFFILEILRGLREERFLERSADGSYIQTRLIPSIDVPSAVKDLIDGRMKGLSESQRAILDVGAVQGITFDPALVAAVLEEKRVRVLRDIAEIERRHGLVRGEDTHIRFDQNQIQEVLYSHLIPDLRREYHSLLAEAYEGSDPCFLALHHLKGNRPKQGLPHVGPALDLLFAAYRNEAAFELIDLALGHVEGTERAELLLRKSARLRLVGRVQEARAAADEAYELARDDALVLRALGARVAVLITSTELDKADALARERLELARRSGNRREEANARVQLGSITGTGRRQYPAALPHYEQALELYVALGDLDGRAFAENGKGICLERSGHLPEALACHASVLELARETGDRNREAGTLVNTGLVHFAAGRLDEAKAHYEQARVILGEIGNRSWEANAIGSIADVYRDQGMLADAIALNLRYVDLKSEVGARGGICTGQLSLGELNLWVGRRELAREYAERARALAFELGQPWARRCRLVLAMVGDPREAEPLLREAVADATDDASFHVGPALLELARLGTGDAEPLLERVAAIDAPYAKVLVPALRGRVDAARSAIEAHGIRAGVLACMEARYRIGDTGEAFALLCRVRDHAPEDCRESVIGNVPLHRAILEAWQRGTTSQG